MEEKNTIPPHNNVEVNNKKNAPDNETGEHLSHRIDKEQQDDIFRMAGKLKDLVTVLFAILVALFCYSQCESTQKKNKEPDTEIYNPQAYSVVPVFTTGCALSSPQSTTSRLLTI